VHHNIKIPMIGFYTGFNMDVSIVRSELCPFCNGTGASQTAEMLTCHSCKGAGKTTRESFWRAAHAKYARAQASEYTGFDHAVTVNCRKCEGSGKLASEPCPRCSGKKTLDGKVTVTVNVEPGMLEGHAFTFKEHAEQVPDAVSGDVILHIYSEEHEHFEREGNDLIKHENITLMEALLGFSREIKHLDGRMIQVSRTEVTQPGQEHVVPGMGMPLHKKPGEFGNLVLKLNIIFPERIAVDADKVLPGRMQMLHVARSTQNAFFGRT
jgi:DnaJ-related protein SCJ1